MSDTQADVVLAFNGTDFDSNKTDVSLKLLKEGVLRNNADMETSNIMIYAIDEGSPSLIATSNPDNLFENTLNGSTINLLLGELQYKADLYTSNFRLNNAPAGAYIKKLTRNSNTNVTIEIGCNNIDFDQDIINFTVTALPNALSQAVELTSNNMTITALK